MWRWLFSGAGNHRQRKPLYRLFTDTILFRVTNIGCDLCFFVVGLHFRWEEQTEEKKQQVRKLVNEGRLEFINGGYVERPKYLLFNLFD
jgi:hypothetical protein